MDKLKMVSYDNVQGNIEKIRELFPNSVTEVLRDGKPTLKVDFDVLKQEMSDTLIDDKEERYQFTWPDKKKSILLANTPVNATLRPCREESVDFDNTENLYIEGDNLDVLKLLQETYLGKIKMIYIDPPYNTGNDFVYNDDYTENTAEYLESSGQYDEQGNRLVQNTESNGRFHTDWLNMIYPRLKVAKDLLSDDGVIFISIDDNEVENLKKICNEVFGEMNCVATLPTIMNLKGNNDQFAFAGTHEYTIVFAKNIELFNPQEFAILEDETDEWERDEIGYFKKGANLKSTGVNAPREKRPNLFFPVYVDDNNQVFLEEKENTVCLLPITGGQEMSWRWSKTKMLNQLYDIIVQRDGSNISLYKKQRPQLGDLPSSKPKSVFYKPAYSSGNGTKEQKELFDNKVLFSNPKPISLIKDFITIGTKDDVIILDFFSGSATTAHAVMQLNAEDGGNRKFIMVQLPEKCDEKSEAFKAGYKNICEIGKERIRRAGKKILETINNNEKSTIKDLTQMIKEDGLFETTDNLSIKNISDVGFRVLKLDSSNMKDVYYKPSDYTQSLLDSLESNIKEDRTPLDLLFQVMLSLGKPLSAKIEEKEIAGKKVFIVNDDDLIACFDDGITEEVVKEIAKKKPLFAVFRDSGLSSDSTSTNFDQIFATYSPNTERRVL